MPRIGLPQAQQFLLVRNSSMSTTVARRESSRSRRLLPTGAHPRVCPMPLSPCAMSTRLLTPVQPMMSVASLAMPLLEEMPVPHASRR